MWYGPGAAGWVMWLLFAVVMLALAAAAGLLVRTAATRTPLPRPAPQQILAERFARGEIGVREYQERLHTLRVADASGPGRVPPDQSPPTESP